MKTYITSIATGLLLTAALLGPTPAGAQLQEVHQTVYGMDCAPCAYAQENRLKAMDGIEQATVSLNEGMATVQLMSDNEITLEQIRNAVRKSGFSPEEAVLTLQGTLSQEHGRWVLTTPAQERYRLTETGEITSASGDAVKVTGTVSSGEKPDSGWALQVTTLETQA